MSPNTIPHEVAKKSEKERTFRKYRDIFSNQVSLGGTTVVVSVVVGVDTVVVDTVVLVVVVVVGQGPIK